MPLRWPRALVALLIVSGTAALGVGMIGAGTAAAAATPCAALVVTGSCPVPSGALTAVSPSDTGGSTAIKTNWSGVPGDGHIDGLHVMVTWTSTGGPSGAPQPAQTSFDDILPCQSVATSGDPRECDVAWPSALEANGYVLNGKYSVSVSASTCPNDTKNMLLHCSQASSTQTSPVSVHNPPTAPPNVKATLGPGNAVTITWDASPEPDVFAYAVRRSGSSVPVGGCQLSYAPAELKGLPACPVPLASTDSTSGGGAFTYQVSAIRFGDTYAFDHSVETATVTKSITVPGPPATTVPGGGTGTTPGGGTGFGVFNAPKVKPSSSTPTQGAFPKIATGTTATTLDPGYSPLLPYGPTTPTTAAPTVAAPPVVAVPKGKSSVKSIALVGAGLLITVVAMHGLWLRSEVKRSGSLEVLEPEL